MARKYLNFDLRISRGAEGYCAGASSPELGETGPVNLSSPFHEGEFEALLTQAGVLRRDLETAPGGQAPPKVRELGRRLFAAALRDGIGAFWAATRVRARHAGKGLRLRLILQDDELWSWPWEVLADPDGGLLVLSPDISIVRYPEVPQPVTALEVKLPVRVLVVASNPQETSPLGCEQELGTLKSLLKAGKGRRRWRLERLEHATLSELEQALDEKRFHILHFIGHGTLDRKSGEGVLLFETEDGRPEEVSGGDLATIIGDRLPLVVLNACEGGRAPREDPFAGVAQSLIRGGIPAVVAMQFRVADEASIVFSRALYKSLAKGASLDEAVRKGRRALFAGYFGFDWANPVLYMRASEGRILHIKKPWELWLSTAAAILLLPLIGLIFRNDIRYWLIPAPPVVISDPSCPSPPGLNLPFAKITPGRFSMGSARGSKEERPAHEVEISRPYCIGKFEVTQRQWRQVMGESPSHKQSDFLPVEGVAWTDIQQFLDGLNRRDPAGHYRLPTEAEWELAAVAGGGSVDPDKVSEYGNCLGWWDDGFSKTARVGTFKPNGRGIFDLFGNVSEWVSDWYGPYSAGKETDPRGATTGMEKVRRGGYFGNSPANCSATYRNKSKPDRRAEDTGFRVVREVVQQK